jgi:predicted MFS family arabinose efflux permease
MSMLTSNSLFGRVLQGYVADHAGRFNVVIVTTAASGTLVLTLWLLSGSGVQLFVFAGSYGFLASAFTSLAPALVAQISGMGQTGTRMGVQSAVMSVAVLIGSPIGGQLLKLCHKSFAGLQVFTGAAMMTGSCIFFIAKFGSGRDILSKV